MNEGFRTKHGERKKRRGAVPSERKGKQPKEAKEMKTVKVIDAVHFYVFLGFFLSSLLSCCSCALATFLSSGYDGVSSSM